MYIKNLKKILRKHLLSKYDIQLNNLLSNFIFVYWYYLLNLHLACFSYYYFSFILFSYSIPFIVRHSEFNSFL